MISDKRVIMMGPHPDGEGGISSVISTYIDGGLFDFAPIDYLPTHDPRGKTATVAKFLTSFLKLAVELSRHRVSLLHVHMSVRGSQIRKTACCLLAILFRTPYFVHVHGSDWRLGNISTRGLNYLFRRATEVIVLSQSAANWAREHGATQLRVVHNGVAGPDIASVSQKRSLQVLYLGRFSHEKGVPDLLDAFEIIASEVPGAQLVLAGGGSNSSLSDKIGNCGLSHRVVNAGWVTGGEKEKLLRESAVLALPSYSEGLPMSILEAMANGCAVVATPVGGIPDAIRNGSEGLLVNPGDVNGLAAAIIQLLQDTTLRTRMGAAARARYLNFFEQSKSVGNILKLYQEFGVRTIATPALYKSPNT